MKKSALIIITAVVAVFLIFGGIYFCYNNIGVSVSKLEEDIRSSQKIEDGWTVEGNAGESMAAFISYPQDKSDHTFSVYVKQHGLSFGYFFRAGGDVYEIEKGIAEFTLADYSERAFISMNSQKVVKAEISGSGGRTIEIDPERPFAFVLPCNMGSVTFYDADGSIVEYLSRSM